MGQVLPRMRKSRDFEEGKARVRDDNLRKVQSDLRGGECESMMWLCNRCWADCRPTDISLLATKNQPCGCCANQHQMARAKVT